jgi:aryl-alcohol dehydrogenase-like predicted oxidoreductase
LEYIDFGKTGMKVSRTAFGALPIQRCNMEDSAAILRRAYESGINFYDTARGYTDSEEKIGYALGDVRDKILIATKTPSKDPESVRKDLETSLRVLNTGYIDLYQFHNYYPTDELIDLVQGFIREGKVLHMGLTLHKRDLAFDAVRSGKFESLQFPFSGLSDEEDRSLVKECEAAGMGFIAMKAMGGGLIQHVEANFAFIRAEKNVLPIWGIQRMEELEQFLELEERHVALTDDFRQLMAEERAALGDRFCRGCGYCLPCPANIELNMACRMDLFMTRAPYAESLTPQAQEKMNRIENCTECGACATRCPYGLKPYELIKTQLVWYRNFVAEHQAKTPQ